MSDQARDWGAELNKHFSFLEARANRCGIQRKRMNEAAAAIEEQAYFWENEEPDLAARLREIVVKLLQ